MTSQVFYIKYNAYPTVSPTELIPDNILIKFNAISVPNVINTEHDLWFLFPTNQAQIQGTPENGQPIQIMFSPGIINKRPIPGSVPIAIYSGSTSISNNLTFYQMSTNLLIVPDGNYLLPSRSAASSSALLGADSNPHNAIMNRFGNDPKFLGYVIHYHTRQ